MSLGEQERGRNDIGERSGNRDVAGEILVWLCGAMLAALVTIMIYMIVTKIIIANGKRLRAAHSMDARFRICGRG